MGPAVASVFHSGLPGTAAQLHALEESRGWGRVALSELRTEERREGGRVEGSREPRPACSPDRRRSAGPPSSGRRSTERTSGGGRVGVRVEPLRGRNRGRLSYGPPWAHYLGGYQDRLLGGPLGLPGLRYTAPEGVEHKDYAGVVLG
jgi:hypothetical protein